jgi:hypothetical protein
MPRTAIVAGGVGGIDEGTDGGREGGAPVSQIRRASASARRQRSVRPLQPRAGAPGAGRRGAGPARPMAVRPVHRRARPCRVDAAGGRARAAGRLQRRRPQGLTLGDVLDTGRRVLHGDATVTWVSEAFLEQHGVGAWIELPLWIPSSDAALRGMLQIGCSKAIAHGLRCRLIADTLLSTYRWTRTAAGQASMSRRNAPCWRPGTPCTDRALHRQTSRRSRAILISRWGGSSAGRAPRSQCGGREFDPPPLHHISFGTLPTP